MKHKPNLEQREQIRSTRADFVRAVRHCLRVCFPHKRAAKALAMEAGTSPELVRRVAYSSRVPRSKTRQQAVALAMLNRWIARKAQMHEHLAECEREIAACNQLVTEIALTDSLGDYDHVARDEPTIDPEISTYGSFWENMRVNKG